jgi:transketolase C-terminal domain/subunit
MIGMAAGLAMENKVPVCYSITPFLIYRPFEFIRNFMQVEKIPIKLVGSGRGKDYIDSGFTHFSEEVGPILGKLENISTFFPENESELLGIIPDFLSSNSPAFLSLRKYS